MTSYIFDEVTVYKWWCHSFIPMYTHLMRSVNGSDWCLANTNGLKSNNQFGLDRFRVLWPYGNLYYNGFHYKPQCYLNNLITVILTVIYILCSVFACNNQSFNMISFEWYEMTIFETNNSWTSFPNYFNQSC